MNHIHFIFPSIYVDNIKTDAKILMMESSINDQINLNQKETSFSLDVHFSQSFTAYLYTYIHRTSEVYIFSCLNCPQMYDYINLFPS